MKLLSIFILFLTLSCSAQTISLVSTGSVGNLRPPMNEDGQLAYRPVLNSGSLYLGKPGTPIQFIVATNGPIPGSPPYTFSLQFGRSIPNGTNQVAFYESGGGGGLIANLNGTLYRAAVRSNQVAGLTAGVLYMTGTGTTIDRWLRQHQRHVQLRFMAIRRGQRFSIESQRPKWKVLPCATHAKSFSYQLGDPNELHQHRHKFSVSGQLRRQCAKRLPRHIALAADNSTHASRSDCRNI